MGRNQSVPTADGGAFAFGLVFERAVNVGCSTEVRLRRWLAPICKRISPGLQKFFSAWTFANHLPPFLKIALAHIIVFGSKNNVAGCFIPLNSHCIPLHPKCFGQPDPLADARVK